MNPSQLKRALKKGGHVFGCMLSAMASTRFGPTLAGAGIDYAIIDAEHGSRDRAEIQSLCTMLSSANVTPVVRVPIPKSEWVAMALDAGTAQILPLHGMPFCRRNDCLHLFDIFAIGDQHARRASIKRHRNPF